jgi:hypothetical protein
MKQNVTRRNFLATAGTAAVAVTATPQGWLLKQPAPERR